MLTAVVGECLVHAAVGAGGTDRTGSLGVCIRVASVEGVLPVPGHSVLSWVPCVTGVHRISMMWLFNIKRDGAKTARLVGRGDFDPNAVYCGNVAASSVKL
jgi:hypothetical protein